MQEKSKLMRFSICPDSHGILTGGPRTRQPRLASDESRITRGCMMPERNENHRCLVARVEPRLSEPFAFSRMPLLPGANTKLEAQFTFCYVLAG